MSRRRIGPQPQGEICGEPFGSVTDAWIWGVVGTIAKLEGARTPPDFHIVPRPCEPGDVVLTAARLRQRGELREPHLDVLVRYGREVMAPDPRRPQQQRDARLWRDALQRLEPPLRAKGIVA